MKKILLGILSLFSVFGAVRAAGPDAPALRESVPFTVREGLPATAAKLDAGEPVTIAYFGGSITEQNGWRIQSAELLKKLYPKAAIRSINAAIGGTGSDLGAFRLAHDVLRHKPDLVFIEFAVNDAGAKDDRVRKAVEGIVRQIRKALPDNDICFVYTVTKGNLKDYQAGRLPRPASIMEEIAEHYRLPSVNLSYEVARLEKDGKLVMSGSKEGMTRVSGDELDAKAGVPRNAEGKIVFSGDGVHPYPDTGHVLYTRMLEQAFPALLAKREQKTRILPAPMRADCWENASAFPLDAPGIRLGGRCRLLPAGDPIARPFAHRMEKLWQFDPGATIEFKFKGTKAMLYDFYGPDSAMLEITVDGKSRETRRFDGYCTYRRLSLCSLADNLPDEVHTVKIRVLPTRFDKREILFERNRADFDKNPKKYEPFRCHAGTLFLVGELVP